MAAKHDPFDDLLKLRDRMNELFENSLSRQKEISTGGVFNPAVDLEDVGDAYRLVAELPGVSPEDVELSVSGETAIIRGERPPKEGRADCIYHRMERSFGHFIRRFNLPEPVDRDKVEAVYALGVLTVTLPKQQVRGRRVPISKN